MGQGGVVFYFLMGRNTQQGFGIDKGTGVISEHGAVLRDPEQVHPDGAGQEPGQQRGQRHQQGPGDHPVQDGNRLLRWSRDQARRLPARSCGQSGGLCSEQDCVRLCVFTVTRSQARRRRVERYQISTDPCSLSSLSSLTQSAWGYFERQNSSYKSTY